MKVAHIQAPKGPQKALRPICLIVFPMVLAATLLPEGQGFALVTFCYESHDTQTRKGG